MIVLLDNVTAVTPNDMQAVTSPRSIPSFAVVIEGGTATVPLYQGNGENDPILVGTAVETGVYTGSGLLDWVGAEVTEISGATVTVTVAGI